MAKVQCANCDRTLGNLEEPMELGDLLVCSECHTRLLTVPPLSPGPMHPSMRPQQGQTPTADYASARAHTAATAHVQTIEQTSKKWKLRILLSIATMLVGFACILVWISTGPHPGGPGPFFVIATILFLGGLLGSIVARIGAWWYHG